MKKRYFVLILLLSFALLSSGIESTPTVHASSTSIAAIPTAKTELVAFYDTSAKKPTQAELKAKLDAGIPVAIYLNPGEAVDYYPVFKELGLPVSLSVEESTAIEQRYPTLYQPEDRKKFSAVEQPSMETAKADSTEQVWSIVPVNGRLFMEKQELQEQGNARSALKAGEEARISREEVAGSIAAYQADLERTILPRAAATELSSNATLMKSIRVSQTFYGDFYFAGFTSKNLKAYKHVTDYMIYNAQDSDPNYDYLIVEGISQVTPFIALNSGPPYATRAFQGTLDNYYGTDTLLDWSPDTTSINLNSGSSYSFSVGYPLAISFNYTWSGGSTTFMQGVGNKDDQYYHNLLVRNQDGGLSTSAFTVKYSAMYKSAGSLLKLYWMNPAGLNLNGTPAGYTWYGNSYQVLEYDY